MQEQALDELNDPRHLGLWRASKESYSSPNEYEKQVMEQYKIAVEMADRVSTRRMLSNSFFVTVHTTIIAAVVILAKENYSISSLLTLALFIVIIVLCVLWWHVINSYKALNIGKYQVICAIEERLPLSIYGAEWMRIAECKDDWVYNPLTYIEQWVPWVFVAMYLCLGIVIMTRNVGL